MPAWAASRESLRLTAQHSYVLIRTGGGDTVEVCTRLQLRHELPIRHPQASELPAIGLPPGQIINSITSRAAKCLGIAERVGAIRKGLDADLVVVGRNPLDDITALKDV